MPPEIPNEVRSAREVGEPPLVPAKPAYFALEGTIRACRVERGLEGLFRLAAQATVEVLRRACDVTIDQPASSGEQGGS